MLLIKRNYCFVPVQTRPECDVDNDCPDEELCYSGSCQNACFFENCGIFAECVTRGHRARCICPNNLVGDPKVACRPSRFLLPIYVATYRPSRCWVLRPQVIDHGACCSRFHYFSYFFFFSSPWDRARSCSGLLRGPWLPELQCMRK